MVKDHGGFFNNLSRLCRCIHAGNFAFVLLGVVIGQFVGTVPGIGPVMAMAIAIPFTFADPLAGSVLVGVNKGFGGRLPAILINTPGTPDAAATAMDGHPLARNGKPQKATKMALFASVTGDTFSDIVLITVSAPLAIIALKMGPVEVFALMIFTFSVLSGLIGASLIKGVIATTLGILSATVGADPENYTSCLILGIRAV